MLSRVLILFSILVALTVNAYAIRLSVLDKDTRQPVLFAYVNVYDGTSNAMMLTSQTDEMGICNITPEKYPVVVEVIAMGYGSFSQTYYTEPSNPVVTILLAKKFSSINEVVVTGNAQPTRLKDALSSYQVISKAQIQSMGAVTLNEALRNQVNIQLSNDPVLGSNMGMQGLSGNKVKILIDGIPVNGREGGNVNLSQINLNNVEKIEIVQGPMSVVYGSDALGGVINVITKKESKPFGISAGTYYETVGRYNIDASATFKLKKRHQFTLGGGRNYFKGYGYMDTIIETPVTRANVTDTYSLLKERSMFFKPNEQYIGNFAYGYTALSGFKIQAASDNVHETVTNKGMLRTWNGWGSDASDEYYYTTRSMNRILLNGKIGKKGIWQSQNGFNVYHRIRKSVTTDMNTLVETLAAPSMQDTSTFNDFTSRSSYTNSVGILNYTAGYDIGLSFAKSLKIPGHHADIQDYAAYTNLSAALIKNVLTAQAGFRFSHNSAYQAPPVIPSFNLLYTPLKNMQVRASYAQGFRAPGLKELYLSFVDLNHDIQGNPDLKAEKSQHIQASVSYQLYEKQSDYLQVILTGYYNDVRNGITLVPLHPEDPRSIMYKYGNLFRQQNTIGTIQIDGQWENLHAQLAYSRNYTMAQYGYYDGYNTGEATVTLQYTMKPAGVTYNLIHKYLEPRPRILTGIDGSPVYSGLQMDYSMLDVSVEKSFWKKKLQIVAGVKNVLNVTQVNVVGGAVVFGGAHGMSGGPGGFLPRSLFFSTRLSL